jgi:hypothetical protein
LGNDSKTIKMTTASVISPSQYDIEPTQRFLLVRAYVLPD